MELMVKCSAAAVFSALCSLLLKRYHPELSFSLSAVTLCVVLLASLRLLADCGDFVREVETSLGADAAQARPILKCLAIAAVTRLGSDLCRDAQQSALASALETAGTLCAAAVAMPGILSLVRMLAAMG